MNHHSMRNASLNSERVALHEAKISVLDRGFLFGDAVYEVARIYGGRLFLWDAHLRRLRTGLEKMRICGVDFDRLGKEAESLVGDCGYPEATLYIQITRGVVPVRTHSFAAIPKEEAESPMSDAFPPGWVKPTELMYVHPFDDSKAKDRRDGVSVISFADLRWGRVDIKTVNLLGNIFAAQAAKEAKVSEAVLVREDGTITEGSHTNVMAVIDGVIRTMPLSQEILPGVTRDAILKLAAELSLPVSETAFTLKDVANATEMFLTGTTTEITPIVLFDGKMIGTGEPGPLTRKLQDALGKIITAYRN